MIDVRELPISRRKGFAKTALSVALSAAGIDYRHLKGLGDPKEGREAARRNEIRKFLAVFGQHMKTAFAQEHLREATDLAVKGGACLMCYERDHEACHRTLVARAIADTIPITVRHLGVRVGLANAEATDRRGPPRRGAAVKKSWFWSRRCPTWDSATAKRSAAPA